MTDWPALVVMMVLREGLIDVAIGVEHVFEQPLQAACADAVEIGPDLGPLVGDLMAGRRSASVKICCPTTAVRLERGEGVHAAW